MGNLVGSEDQIDDTMTETEAATYHGTRRNSGKKVDTSRLVKLFEKLEATATGDDKYDDDKHLSKTTFESVFDGPLQSFGKLMFLQLVQGHSEKDGISQHHFIKSGKVILRLVDATTPRYYFNLFAASKDHLTKSDALEMVQCCFVVTMTASSIPCPKVQPEDHVFHSMVESMFGIHESLTYESLSTWMSWNTPHLFSGLHSYVLLIMQGARMPSEMETTEVPHLDCIIDGSQLISLPVLWAISTTLPACYLQTDSQAPTPTSSNLLLNTFTLALHQAHLSRFQSWALLYSSRDHGLSMNRDSLHTLVVCDWLKNSTETFS